jgi:hypothetical protein
MLSSSADLVQGELTGTPRYRDTLWAQARLNGKVMTNGNSMTTEQGHHFRAQLLFV